MDGVQNYIKIARGNIQSIAYLEDDHGILQPYINRARMVVTTVEFYQRMYEGRLYEKLCEIMRVEHDYCRDIIRFAKALRKLKQLPTGTLTHEQVRSSVILWQLCHDCLEWSYKMYTKAQASAAIPGMTVPVNAVRALDEYNRAQNYFWPFQHKFHMEQSQRYGLSSKTAPVNLDSSTTAGVTTNLPPALSRVPVSQTARSVVSSARSDVTMNSPPPLPDPPQTTQDVVSSSPSDVTMNSPPSDHEVSQPASPAFSRFGLPGPFRFDVGTLLPARFRASSPTALPRYPQSSQNAPPAVPQIGMSVPSGFDPSALSPLPLFAFSQRAQPAGRKIRQPLDVRPLARETRQEAVQAIYGGPGQRRVIKKGPLRHLGIGGNLNTRLLGYLGATRQLPLPDPLPGNSKPVASAYPAVVQRHAPGGEDPRVVHLGDEYPSAQVKYPETEISGQEFPDGGGTKGYPSPPDEASREDADALEEEQRKFALSRRKDEEFVFRNARCILGKRHDDYATPLPLDIYYDDEDPTRTLTSAQLAHVRSSKDKHRKSALIHWQYMTEHRLRAARFPPVAPRPKRTRRFRVPRVLFPHLLAAAAAAHKPLLLQTLAAMQPRTDLNQAARRFNVDYMQLYGRVIGPDPTRRQLERLMLFARALGYYSRLGEGHRDMVYRVLASRRAYVPGLPVQLGDLRWGMQQSSGREAAWFREQVRLWMGGWRPEAVERDFIYADEDEEEWAFARMQEIREHMIVLGLRSEEAGRPKDEMHLNFERAQKGYQNLARLLS